MSQRVLAEVVSQYVDSGNDRAQDYAVVLGGHSADLEPLFGIVRLLRSVLVPVEPSPEYVTALRARLLTMPVEDLPPAAPVYDRRLVYGAVAFGSLVSAAAAYVIYSRTRAARAA